MHGIGLKSFFKSILPESNTVPQEKFFLGEETMAKSVFARFQWSAGRRTSSKVYITRVFNFGTPADWKKMKRRYSRKEIERAVKNPLKGQWTRRAMRFAELLFNVKMPEKALISYDV